MENQTFILCISTALVALIHTVLGPDHYIPFIAMAKSAKWSSKKTLSITVISGLGHVLSSVIIGLIGISAGVLINQVEAVEEFRADLAAWLFISFGLIYFIWGIKKIWMHKHSSEHIHMHKGGTLTPWIIFTVFVLGPCEPLIPLLIYPSVMENVFIMITVVLIFASVTTLTMAALVTAGLYGIELLNMKFFEKYTHALAGFLILLCGISIKFMGL